MVHFSEILMERFLPHYSLSVPYTFWSPTFDFLTVKKARDEESIASILRCQT